MTVVYIMSKDRPESAAKTWKQLDRHNEDEYDIFVTVEPQDVKKYKHAGFVKDDMHVLPKDNGGAGYARRMIHRHARRSHRKHFIMADDDLNISSPFHPLVDFLADYTEVLGCGAFASNYGLWMGDHHVEPFPVSGSLGYNLFAVNTENLHSIGSYEPQLNVYQDDLEVCRLWIRDAGVPWYVHPDVKMSMGKRWTEGGASSVPGRAEKQLTCHQFVFNRWGERYISKPPKKFRCSWKRLLSDYAADYVEEIYG